MKLLSVIKNTSLLTLLALSATTPVLADTTTPQAANSTAKVGILTGTKDPDDPNDPGPLALDHVPDIDFGINELDNGGSTYHVQKLDESRNPTGQPLDQDPYAQVTDRRNTGAGWTLQVKYDTDGYWKSGDKKISGGVLNFGTPTFTSLAENNVSAAPTKSGTTEISDADANIASSDESAGMGTWKESFKQDDTTLFIPSGNSAGDYEATLVWTLTDANLG